MISHILKRVLSAVLVVMLMIGMIPWAASTVYAADTQLSGLTDETIGLSIKTDAKNWFAYGSKIEGSATGKPKVQCTAASAGTDTLIIKNNRETTAKLSFTYIATLAGGSVTIAGNSISSKGTYESELAAGASVEIVLTSAVGAFTTKIQIEGIHMSTLGVKPNVTFLPGENGTYMLGDAPLEEEKAFQNATSFGYQVSAEPASGYRFASWKDENGRVLSNEASTTLHFEEDTRVKPHFLSESMPTFSIGNTEYYDLKEAIEAVRAGGGTIIVTHDGAISAGNYEIPTGVTMLVPWRAGDFGEERTASGSIGIASCTLTVPSDATITVSGTLLVNAMQGQGSTYYMGQPVGNYGKIELSGTINVADGGTLNVRGLILGDGEVTAQSGAKVYELLQVTDFRGGTATTGIYDSVCPLNLYYFESIQTPLIMEYGAKITGKYLIYMNAAYFSGDVSLIGDTSRDLIQMQEGSRIVLSPTTNGKIEVSMSGKSSINSLILDLIGVEIDTAKYECPIHGGLQFVIKKDSVVTMNSSMKLLPGASISIEDGGEWIVAENAKLYLYDVDDYQSTYKVNETGYTFQNYRKLPQTEKINTTYTEMEDAKLQVAGKLTVHGEVYSSNAGSNGSGLVSVGDTGIIDLTGSTTVPGRVANIKEAIQKSSGAKTVDSPFISLKGVLAGDAEYRCLPEKALYYSDGTSWYNYTVLFDTNGTGIEEPSAQHLLSGAAVTMPAEEGDKCLRWYEDAACKEPFDFSGTVLGDISLYAGFVHDWGEWIADEADKDKHIRICKNEETHKEYGIHVWGEGEETLPATCTNEGETTYSCTICKVKEVCPISVLGHLYGEWTVKTAATCSTEGEKERNCARCQDIESSSIAIDENAHQWDDGVITEAAGCSDEGVLTRTCVYNEAHKKTEVINPSGHKPSLVLEHLDPTCTQDGSDIERCEVCQAIINAETLPALGHDYESVVVEPSCTVKGYTIYTCSRGDSVYEDTEVAALGHDFSTEWTTDKEASCTEEGSKSHHCSRCEEKSEVTAISVVPHTFGEWSVTKEATYDAEGEKTQTCTVCGTVATEAIPKLTRSSSSKPTVTVTVPVVAGDNSVKIKATVKNGTAALSISDKDLRAVIDDANSGIISINVSGLRALVHTAELSKEVIESIATAGSAVSGLKITFDEGIITLNSEALVAVVSSMTKDTVTFTLKDVTSASVLSRLSIPAQAVFELQVQSGGKSISDFEDGVATVSVDYTMKDNSKIVVAYHVAEDGTMTRLSDVVYDRTNTRVSFSTPHFSRYAIAEEADWVNPFTDVAPYAWYYDAVKYAYENKLFSGITATTFEPETAMERSMLVTVLYGMEGKPSVKGSNHFADVAKGSWYEAPVLWASENGIASGFGNSSFKPSDSLTREQIAVILYQYAKYKGCDVSTTTKLSGYTDTGLISSWAREAMLWANAEGLIKGRTATTLAPTGTATRAEVAAMVGNLMKMLEN